MNEKFLPIGTVVELAKQEGFWLMIVGLLPENSVGERRDYIAVRYPTGVLNKDNYYFFNHEQIGKIVHEGLEHEDHTVYVSLLQALLKREQKKFKEDE